MNEIVEQSSKSFSLAPQNIEEALKFADMMSKSNLVPKEFTGNAGNILVAIQWGMELGLQPMQAMQNIAVINGRPSLWGDSVIAIVKGSPVCEYVVEETTETQSTCKVKRKGEPEQTRTFTIDDAKKANLWGKQGPWSQYPKRMLQMRARSWALRDVFPDVLRGMPIAEELQDMPNGELKDITPKNNPAAPAAKEVMSDERFEKNKEAYFEQVKLKGKSPDSLIAFIESKTLLTDEQKEVIRSFAVTVIENEASQSGDVDPFVAEMEQAESAGQE